MKLKTIILALLITSSIAGCKKDSPDPDIDGTTGTGTTNVNTGTTGNTAAAGGVLCNGKNENTYFPQKANNSWTYSGSGMGGGVRKMTDTITYGGKLYTTQKITSSLTGDSYYNYFRVDASGNIYEYVKVDSKEYMYLPASPTVGQEWPYRMSFGEGKRKVISLTATIKTGNCEYKNLLEVHSFDPGGTLNTKYFYKKGLGLVSYTTFSSTHLTAVTLN